MKFFKEKKVDVVENIDIENIPEHIAIIMDGNGRWAKKKGLPRTLGHKAGVETIRNIVKECSKLKVKYLTLYAFSTENWKRPVDEVNALMKLLVEYLKSEFEELNKNDVVINYIGNIDGLPEICKNELILAHEKTKNNKGVVLNLALNYGGRNEIIHAINSLVEDLKLNKLKDDTITEEIFERYLYTASMPDPDLIIRPSGELRVSNFLLWQCAYSEFWYSDICWPDFKPEDLRKAIIDYQKRSRRFGGLK